MNKLSSMCVFCGSSAGRDPAFKEGAISLGRAMAINKTQLVYGGGSVGMMGAIADSVMDNGGEVIGVIPEHLQRKEVAATNITRLEVVDSMHSRKMRMFQLSEAFCVMAGGFGTLDEMFEILTWRQLGLHARPVIILNLQNIWGPLENLVDHMVECGYVSPTNRQFLTFVEKPEDVLPAAIARLGQENCFSPPSQVKP